MLVLRISLRYLRTRPIALVSAVCVALAVMAMIVVTSVMDGMRERHHERLRLGQSDLAFRVKGPSVPRPGRFVAESLKGRMAAAGGPIAALAPRLETIGVLEVRREDRRHHFGVRIVGIDFDAEREVTGLGNLLTRDGSEDALAEPLEEFTLEGPVDRVLVGQKLARRYGLATAGRVDPLAERYGIVTRLNLVTGRPVIGADDAIDLELSNALFDVGGTFSSREDVEYGTVFVDRFALHELRYGRGSRRPDATTVEARLVPEERPRLEAWAARFEREHPRLEVITFHERNKGLLDALDVEKWAITLILALVITITVALVFGLLYLMVREKTRDVGVLRAMGFSRRGTLLLFLTYAFELGLIGAGLGTVAGVAIVRNIDEIVAAAARQGIHVFRPELSLDFVGLPAVLDPVQVSAIFFLALGLAALSGLLASGKAAAMDPIRCLRHE